MDQSYETKAMAMAMVPKLDGVAVAMIDIDTERSQSCPYVWNGCCMYGAVV